jgi:nicotinamide phosphoribosyltransferase
VAGFSIPAAEHSTITSWGRDGEVDAYRNMLNQFAKPGAILAVVSDSYDIYNAVENLWGGELRQQVIDSGATIVIRPDSGDPEIVCRKLVQLLGDKFGYTTNSKGFKVLNNVRLIQGDGINEHTIRCILGSFQAYGWSADNIAFGMGGALLQQLDRDTQKFAMKCSSALINGRWVDVQKDPITDPGKKSKAGRVTLWRSGGEWVSAVDRPTGWHDKAIGDFVDVLEEVYRDGRLVKEITFDQVRANTRK